ncbi:MAG: imelysin family protein [Bacteroidota bacterium]
MKTQYRFTYLALLAVGLMFFGIACDSAGDNEEPLDPMDPPPVETFDRAGMLDNVANNIILPAYAAFQESTDALQAAVAAFAGDPTAATLVPAQDALKATRMAWQEVSMFQFGPAESVALRGVLNTYPTNTTQINDNIVAGSYTLGSIQNIAAGGFPAMDYLLHGEGLTPDEIVAQFTSDADASARVQYLTDNVDFVKSNTDFVVQQWAANGGNYVGTFLSEDNGGTDVGSSLGQLINAVVLHFERFTRDGKIGIPAGVRSAGVPRPKATEAFYAGYSVELAKANLESIGRLFSGVTAAGQDGLGLEDNLDFIEQGALADDIVTTLQESITAIEGLSDPLKAQIDDDVNKVVATFTKMQELVVLLKVDMTSFLGISITYQDTDGD